MAPGTLLGSEVSMARILIPAVISRGCYSHTSVNVNPGFSEPSHKLSENHFLLQTQENIFTGQKVKTVTTFVVVVRVSLLGKVVDVSFRAVDPITLR